LRRLNESPKEAFDFLRKKAKAVFVDRRSEMEFLSVGRPLRAT
jgi:hypothetical protein